MGRAAAATPPAIGGAGARRAGAALVLALLLLAALAGSLSDTAGGTATLRGGAASTALTVAATLGGLVVAAIAVFLFYLAVTRRAQSMGMDNAPVRRPWWYSLVVVLAVALLVSVVLLLRRHHKSPSPGTGASASAVPQKAVHPSSVHFVAADSLVTVGVVVLLVVLVVLIGWWRARGLGGGSPFGALLRRQHDVFPAEPAPGLAASIAAVRVLRPEEETDPRRAVVACYVAMTRAAAAAGAERSPSETPSEFLQRLLAALGASHSAAARLTSLFETARYTTKPVDEQLRGDAIRALGAVQRELQHLFSSSGPTRPRSGADGSPTRLSTVGRP